jgi:DNA mismatch repair protein MutS
MFMIRPLLFLAIVFSHFFIPMVSVADSIDKRPSVYHAVTNEFLKTFGSQEKPVESGKNEKAEQKGLVVEDLSLFDQYHAVGNMFAEHGVFQSNERVIDPAFIKKMEILCGGENASAHLFGKLSHAQTVFGDVALASVLVNPLTDSEALQKRQNIIRTLLADEQLQDELTDLFAELNGAQANILSFWHDENPMNHKLYQNVYFGQYLKQLNKNSVALEGLTRLRNFRSTMVAAYPFILIPTLNALMEWSESGQAISKTEALKRGFKRLGSQIKLLNPNNKITFKDRSFSEIKEEFEAWPDEVKREKFNGFMTAIQPQCLGDVIDLYEDIGVPPLAVKGGLAAYSGLILGTYGFGVKNAVDLAKVNTTVTNHIHQRLIDLAKPLHLAKEISALLNQYEEIAAIPEMQVINNYVNKSDELSTELKDLLGMLQRNTFKGSPSFFTLTGRVLAAFRKVQEVKNELVPLLEALGRIEAHLSIVKLYKKHENMPASFCFAEFAAQDKPTIAMEGFWNPFIDPQVVVANNAYFNVNDTSRNMILTGPNTAGKSTVIKGVALNILLAQTFGIAPAKRVIISPFKIINCHLNINDDITTGSSLFHAEVKRARALLEDVRSLKADQFCFTIMDEVFNGTNAEGGSQAAYNFACDLGEYENLILVIATHFGNLTALDQAGDFRNQYVDARLNDDGSLERPFKLFDGIFQDPENKILQAILVQEGISSAAMA